VLCGLQEGKVAGTLSEWFRVKKGVRQGWRKGLRRILSLPYNTHSRLISPVCDFLPVREELICRCTSFIIKCLNICNSVVHSVSRNGIYGMRMHSPIVANVQFCCNYYGMSPNDIPYVNKRLAWTVLWNSFIAPDLDKIKLIKEVQSFTKVRFHYFASQKLIL